MSLIIVLFLSIGARAAEQARAAERAPSAETINRLQPEAVPQPVLKDASLTKSAVGPGFTVIPLPAFTYNRNEGTWMGGLTPIFRANDQGEVEDIFAPLYLHNSLIGETFTFNYFGYRRHHTQYHAIVSHATKIERTVDVSYKNTALSDGHFLVVLQANSGKSAFNRFFGFGNRTADQLETQYTMGDANIVVGGGLNLSKAATLIARQRYRSVGIENGASKTLPQTLQAYPDIPGIDGANVVGQGLVLSYDTRDNDLTPLRGTFATALAEYDQNIKFSERNHWWRMTAEARHFYPHADDRMVFVWHVLADAVVGQDENSSLEDTIEQDTGQVDAFGNPILQPIISKRLIRRGVPFFERPTLGGETTLRGFGRGRFVSNTAWLINLEERISVLRRSIMGNMIEIEVAPFVDIGRVGRSFFSQNLVQRAQVNPGGGLRLLARPNIAGRLDVAYGKDGPVAYVGLDYPF